MDIKGIITKEDYINFNIDFVNDLPKYLIKLKDGRTGPVLSTLEKNGKTKRTVYFAKIDKEYYRFDEETSNKFKNVKRKVK